MRHEPTDYAQRRIALCLLLAPKPHPSLELFLGKLYLVHTKRAFVLYVEALYKYCFCLSMKVCKITYNVLLS